MKIGEQIQLTADQITKLLPFLEDLETSNTAFRKATAWAKSANDNLFKAIHEINPELVGLAISLNHDTGIITVHGDGTSNNDELIEFLRAAEKAKRDPSI